MLPQGRWQPRRRRSDRPWWGLVLVTGVAVAAALVFRVLSHIDQGEPVAFARCPEGSGCATAAAETTPACQGAECAAPGPRGGAVAASDAPPPAITARAAVVLEQSCGALLHGLNPHERLAPASTTKIATALVAVDHARLSEMVDVQVNSALLNSSTGSSVMGLQPGQRLTMRDLLHGLLLTSGNDAAVAIAEHVGGSVPMFVAEMNRKAVELGLRNTHFANPHGLDEPALYTSAFDIALLGRKLLANRELAGIVSARTYQPAWDGPALWNGNKLLYEYPGALGVKTGYTAAAGQTMVAAADRDGRRLVVSVLGSWDRYGDVTALFEWAFAHTVSRCEPEHRVAPSQDPSRAGLGGG